MSVTPSSELWVVCASCGEIVQQSAGAHVLLSYHSPACREHSGQIRLMQEHPELPTGTASGADPDDWIPERPFSLRGRGTKAALGLLAAFAVSAVAAFLVSGIPGSKALPPAGGERQASPVTGASTPPGSRKPGTIAPGHGTTPRAGSPPSRQPAGGIPVAAQPSHPASSAALTPPPGSVLITFKDGADGWSPFWGSITDTPAATPAFEGTPSLVLTASSGRFTAVGTTTDVNQLKPGDTVTYHVWSSGQSGSVQPFIYDDSHVARFGEPASTPLSSSARWFTLTWTIPPTSSVLAIGLQVTNPGTGSLRLAIAALWWPQN